MDNNIFQVPATIETISTLKDKTIKLGVYVGLELGADEMAKIFSLNQKEGWFVFSENTITETDIPKEEVEFKEGKTPSERLRAVYYRQWEKLSQKEKDKYPFTIFYNTKMERIIEDEKGKIDG